MVKKELLNTLIAGKRYDEIDELPIVWIGQGWGYKSSVAYEAGEDYICYIPEYCCNEETLELDPYRCYTRADFLEITGDEEKARELFDAVDWQHLSSLWNEMEIEEEEENLMEYAITMERVLRIEKRFYAENNKEAEKKADELFKYAIKNPDEFEGGDVEHDFALCDEEGGDIICWR